MVFFLGFGVVVLSPCVVVLFFLGGGELVLFFGLLCWLVVIFLSLFVYVDFCLGVVTNKKTKSKRCSGIFRDFLVRNI